MEKNQFEDRDDVDLETLSDEELDLVAGGSCTLPCCNPPPPTDI